MNDLKKAMLGTWVMHSGYVIMIVLTFAFGRSVPIIGLLGIFVALGGYGIAYTGARCPECNAEWLKGPKGFPLLFILPVRGKYTCPDCRHAISSEDYK